MRLPPSERRVVALAVLTFLVALAMLVQTTPLGAQEDDPTAADAELVLSSLERDRDTGEVTAEIIVPVELAGEALPDDAVTVLVGNTRHDVTSAPISSDDLEVVLVIDVSGSMRGEPLEAARAAAASFIALLPAPVDVAVVAFDETATTVSDLDAPREESLAAVANLEVGGDTALFDAIVLAASEFSSEPSTRRVIVALTDGGDSASVASLGQARAALRASDIEPYAVALATSESATENLEQLVAGSVGRVDRTDSIDALLPLYSDLAAQLASRVVISFTPEGNESGQALVLLNANGILAGTALDYGSASVPLPEEELTSSPAVETSRTPTPVIAISPNERVHFASGWITSSTTRNIGIASLAVTLFVLGLLISFPSERMSLIADRSKSAASAAQVGDLTGRLEGAAGKLLDRGGRERRLARSLERAGIALRPAEFVVMAGALSVTTAMIVGLLLGPLVGLVVLLLAFFVARWWVSRQARRRSAQFAEQLPATLQLMSGGLRAGYALPQAVEHIAGETQAPTSDEFHRLSTEVRLGRDFGESLHAMATRLESEDFTWVVHAIDIHREVGGDLAEVLDKVQATMRDRSFIRRQVSALSAEGRYSGYLITALPFVVALLLAITNPTYIGRLVEGLRGFVVIAAAIGLVSVGTVWMRTVMKVRY